MAERQVTRGGSLLYDSIADWLMDVALTGESDVQAVVDGACHRLLAAVRAMLRQGLGRTPADANQLAFFGCGGTTCRKSRSRIRSSNSTATR